ncbi:hypothetical protein CS022_13320 [Veronia nyctiphanis]|uniref:Nucleotidyltransferase family protein n=1 Tax=Veronia nyctiphanis TaxID=1278244 RepID=A0A4Q0YPE6_9GAMM|nr:nucleotidyltransferase family protein [Veronia nyctiphanis]RXJ72832.1 hypothetical protein CS022_13320 [Veronia nyctiphanis]
MKQRLIDIITTSAEITETLRICEKIALPNYYLAGGAITQCVWNHLLGLPLLNKVKDFDIVYFDDQRALTESFYETQITRRITHSIPVDVKNQAIVHEWYPRKFGHTITPYQKTEDGIASWLPAFSIGVKSVNGNIEVFSAYGLDDLFSMTVRPNKMAMSEESYLKMTDGFKRRWPEVFVLPWNVHHS